MLAGGVLYGTTEFGGANGLGTLFAVNPSTNALSTLYSFTTASGTATTGPLLAIGTTLYGTANLGGSDGYGTIFSFYTQTRAFSR